MSKLRDDVLEFILLYHPDESVREKAGSRIIQACIDNLDYITLSRLRGENFPEYVRKEAKRVIGDVARKAVEEWANKGHYWEIIDIIKNENVPEDVKMEAKSKAVEIAKELGKLLYQSE